MELTGGEVVIESLVRGGVPYLVGVPGPGVLGLLDACIGRGEHVKCLHTKTDRGAVHLADGYFRATGRPLAVFAGHGAGAIGTAAGLATSYMDSTAVLCLTGAPQTYLVGKGIIGEIGRPHRGHAFPDVLAPLVKRQWFGTSPAQVATALERAFTEMLTGRFGPVHIDLPADVQAEHAEVHLHERIAPPDSWTVPATGDLARAGTLLQAASHPVILAGGGARHGDAPEALRALAEATGAAVATTAQGKSTFPEDHPLSVGMLGWQGAAPAFALVAQADVLLAVGCRFTDRTASGYRHGMGLAIPPTRLIHIDVDPREIGKNYPADVGLVGDAAHTLRALADVLGGNGPATRTASGRIAEARDAWRARLTGARESGTAVPTLSAVVAEAREFLDEDAYIVTGCGRAQATVLREMVCTVPGTHITAGGLGTPGFALPAALGVKLGRPDRQVLAVCGDGDFFQSMPELATAVTYEIPIVVLVCNDGGAESVRAIQEQRFGPDRATGAGVSGTDGAVVDVAAVAAGLGCHAQLVDRADDLQTALAAAFASGTPAVIDCRVPAETAAAQEAGWLDVPVPTYLTDARARYEAERAEQRL